MSAVHPDHYRPTSAQDIETVIEGLPAKEAAHLWNILKYFDRRDDKGQKEHDLGKANNYAHRLVYGRWRDEMEDDCKTSKTSTGKAVRVITADGTTAYLAGAASGIAGGKSSKPARSGKRGR